MASFVRTLRQCSAKGQQGLTSLLEVASVNAQTGAYIATTSHNAGAAKDRRQKTMVSECRERGVNVLRDPKINKVNVTPRPRPKY